jgi:hypothetical protein
MRAIVASRLPNLLARNAGRALTDDVLDLVGQVLAALLDILNKAVVGTFASSALGSS